MSVGLYGKLIKDKGKIIIYNSSYSRADLKLNGEKLSIPNGGYLEIPENELDNLMSVRVVPYTCKYINVDTGEEVAVSEFETKLSNLSGYEEGDIDAEYAYKKYRVSHKPINSEKIIETKADVFIQEISFETGNKFIRPILHPSGPNNANELFVYYREEALMNIIEDIFSSISFSKDKNGQSPSYEERLYSYGNHTHKKDQMRFMKAFGSFMFHDDGFFRTIKKIGTLDELKENYSKDFLFIKKEIYKKLNQFEGEKVNEKNLSDLIQILDYLNNDLSVSFFKAKYRNQAISLLNNVRKKKEELENLLIQDCEK